MTKCIKQARGKNWNAYQGDCVELIKGIPDESIHYSIFSPPFFSLYTYSNSLRDMGNSTSDEEFETHFKFLIKELYRVIKPGRLVSVHCMNIPKTKEKYGEISIRDFRGDIIRWFEDVGFLYHSEVLIEKCPLTEVTRTKAMSLQHKQIVKDSSMCRQGLPDYIVTLRKHGENKEPIAHPDGFTEYIGEDAPKEGVFSHNVWRRYAANVWSDIKQTDTLNYKLARDGADERHICALQRQVIERCVELWSNKGDIILSPFAGIGSEGFFSVKRGRRSIGFELKESYFDVLVKNMNDAEKVDMEQESLFDID